MSTLTISANELKTKGISAIEKATAGNAEAIITVRGEQRFVVLPLETYHHLRECELEAALAEAKRDIKKKHYHQETVDKHIARINRV